MASHDHSAEIHDLDREEDPIEYIQNRMETLQILTDNKDFVKKLSKHLEARASGQRTARAQYLLDISNQPFQVSEAAMKEIRYYFERDRESATGPGRMLWLSDLHLMRLCAVPGYYLNQEGQAMDCLSLLYGFTGEELVMLNDGLGLFTVVECAEEASRLAARFRWQIRHASELKQQYDTELMQLQQMP